jgi:hypothetical protein
MTGRAALSPEQLDRVRGVAAVLVPGSPTSAGAAALSDLDDLLQHAAVAIDGEGPALSGAIKALPSDLSWESLSAFAAADPSSFEQISLLVVGAYFMAPSVLASLGLPTGERKPASLEQAVDELSTGILDPVFERGCPVRTLEDVNGAIRKDLA